VEEQGFRNPEVAGPNPAVPGRKQNKSGPEQLTVSLSKETYGFLTYMAVNGIIGPSESVIAAHIVTREIDKLKKSDYFSRRVPQTGGGEDQHHS
jgi:hypothetical protein